MGNAKQIEDSIEYLPEDDDDDFVDPPPTSKKRKMEKKVAKKRLRSKKAKPSNKLVFHPEGETVVGPEQVANEDEAVVVPKLLKVVADDEMIDVQ
ncbi:hypothetical protein D8674_017421 [Pyrus ussuriensis x Pyrus communis]|uniref:Uncharacterized protein n=1 Tax=Pyrus ussuriensis x Pyrus communis TaxID=2448454 RepID=A0A5N5HHU4_9ROSA|nr:hypothetical protein D8674_017421 [Pyrus ussuriensis x Pyrus communis]